MTERIRVTRAREKDIEYQKTRRKILLLLLGGGGTILAGGAAGYTLDKIHEVFGNDEGSSPNLFKGKELSGGEIIDEDQLVKRYYEILSTKRPLEANQTLISSTLYHAMRFFKLEEDKAKKRAQNVYIANKVEMEGSVCRGVVECVEDGPKGLGTEMSDELFTRINGDLVWTWFDLIGIPSHVAYHLSVDRVLKGYSEENYGFLGRFLGSGSRMGFGTGESEVREPDLDLVNYMFINPKTGEQEGSLLAEEFMAESGKQRYIRHLMDKGLASIPFIKEYASSTIYTFFRQGLIDILDTKGSGGKESWQGFWQYQLSPEVTNVLHLKGDRKNFYENIGRVILSKNKNSSKFKLDKDDIAGVGVVAFADFAIYEATKHQVLQTLISSNNLTQDNLRQIARDLNRRIHSLKLEETFYP